MQSEDDLDRLLLFELDGAGVHLESVEATLLLELASAFFSLVKLNGDQFGGEEFLLRGLRAIEKCAAMGCVPSDREVARLAAARSASQIAGGSVIPYGGVDFAKRARRAAQRLEPGQTMKARLGSWSHAVTLAPELGSKPLDERTTLRARLLKIGGTGLSARFTTRIEKDFRRGMALSALCIRDIWLSI